MTFVIEFRFNPKSGKYIFQTGFESHFKSMKTIIKYIALLGYINPIFNYD
jgi:hypothetical protein